MNVSIQKASSPFYKDVSCKKGDPGRDHIPFDPCLASFRKILNSADPIANLVKCTAFDKREVKLIYRNFKQDCPDGLITPDILKNIYIRFFPCGSPGMYTQHVFRTMDKKKMGKITFKEFLVWLSEISHGTTADKIAWTFRLYDTNEDGFICSEDLNAIIKSIYFLMGKKKDADDDLLVRNKAALFFQRFDRQQKGVITSQDFADACFMDQQVIQSLDNFYTVI